MNICLIKRGTISELGVHLPAALTEPLRVARLVPAFVPLRAALFAVFSSSGWDVVPTSGRRRDLSVASRP
jgi:hypothetical protein